MELKLLQSDVERILKVSSDCVTNWENSRFSPQINYFPRIIEFLGYLPFDVDTSSLPGKLKTYRYINGLSQKRLGKVLKIDASTVYAWENGEHVTQREMIKKLERLLTTNTMQLKSNLF